MVQEIQLRTNLIEEKKAGALLYKAARKLGVDSKEISGIKVLRKSIDARKKETFFNYKVTNSGDRKKVFELQRLDSFKS